MARANETAADRDQIAHAADFGFDLTARTLEDWRRAKALPARNRIDLGRRGTRYEDRPETKDRVIGICLFLKKRGTFRERPDLPRRRRVADAPPWLWYEGFRIPPEEMRDRVVAYWIALDDDLTEIAKQIRAREPAVADYEVRTAVGDEIAEQLAQDPIARRHLAVFAANRDALGDDPQTSLLDAYSQLMQAIQGQPDAEAKTIHYLLQYMFVASRLEEEPDLDPGQLEKVLRALDPANVVRAVWNLDADGWRDVRTFLHVSQGMLISLERECGDPRLRHLARISPGVSRTGSLLMLIGFVAAILPELRVGIDRIVAAQAA